MERPSFKRKGDFSASASRKTPKMTESAPGGKMTFAQRMMAKMGHKEGEGLGKGGEGIVNPIEVKLRPQGAGVGAVKERTEQYKQEQKRAALARGEEYEDSSDEERKARRKRKEQRAKLSMGDSGTSTPGGTRKKTKFRTIEEIQAAAPGLELPKAMLSSIVDATGSTTKLLTSTAGLMISAGAGTQTEEEKIKKRERMELEAFIDAWHGLQERKIYVEEHEGQLSMELSQQEEDITKMQSIVKAIEGLSVVEVNSFGAGDADSAQLDQVILKLEDLQTEFQHEIESCGLSEAAVAVIHPLFRDALEEWEPLERPSPLVDQLQRIRRILGISTNDELTENGHVAPEHRTYRRQKTTTSFETLIYTLWLPKIRSSVTQWDVHDPKPMIDLVESWRPLLPTFVYSNLMDQLIIQKLSSALQSWNPRTASKHRHHKKHTNSKSESSLPHIWLFPWLPYLPPYHLDPKASTGLLSDVKRKFRLTLDTWDIGQGVLPGLSEWHALLRSELEHALIRHLLPRLAAHLSANFEVDPADQDLTPLENVLAWQDFFKPEILSRLLVAELFPKWLSVLHVWLTSPSVDFEEISQWFAWWRTQIPASPTVEEEWGKGLAMVNNALDLFEKGEPLTKLTPPAAGPARPIAKDPSVSRLSNLSSAPKTKKARQVEDETTFKDIVESWCAEQDLTLLPMREAHTGTGAPLFRISASATGKGGVLVYFKGDVVWAAKKGQKDIFEPVGLEDGLVARAEGR